MKKKEFRQIPREEYKGSVFCDKKGYVVGYFENVDEQN